MIRLVLRLALSLLPIGLTPLLAVLIGDGYLNFGGGCKDVLMVFPWIVWSLFYLIISIVGWWKKWSIARGVAFSLLGATGLLVLTFLALLVFSSVWFGIKPS